MSTQPTSQGAALLRDALASQRGAYRRAAWLSTILGVLALTPSWYMFEVYGRVLNSRNTATLWWLVVMVIGVYVMLELLELVRGRALHHAAAGFEALMREHLFNAVFQANLRRLPGGGLTPFNDLKTLRDFMASPFVTSLMDIPSALICLALLTALGVWLGALALVGAVVQVWLMWLTQRHTMPLLANAIASNIQAQNYAAGALRNAQVIESMGMMGRIHARWLQRQHKFLAKQGEASDYAGVTSAAAKMLQVLQSSVLLGGATWVMLNGNLWGGGGMVIVASILGGRALQPLAQLVAQWRAYVQARDAWQRMSSLLSNYQKPEPAMPLPPPAGRLTVEGVHAGPPGTQLRVLRNVSFTAAPGELTLVIGPTASGKSTLARLLVGVWPCVIGKVRLDGADVFAWDKAELGPHIGYLPQSVELFDGTIAENVARFGDIDMDAVRAAVEVVGMTATVDALPQGFDTRIGEEGAVLSGGQRQRLGLARALYGHPQLLVLDEPNSSLDAAGDQQLLELMQRLKQAGTTLIAITHRNTLMPAVDKILVLRDGEAAAFGPRDEVLEALKKAAEKAQAAKAARRGAAAAKAALAAPGAGSAEGSPA